MSEMEELEQVWMAQIYPRDKDAKINIMHKSLTQLIKGMSALDWDNIGIEEITITKEYPECI